jgi:hypothetical protein
MFNFCFRWWCVLLVPFFIFKLQTGMGFFAMLYVSAISALWTAPLVSFALKDLRFLLGYFGVLLVGTHCLAGLVFGAPFGVSVIVSAVLASVTVWHVHYVLATGGGEMPGD